MCCEQPDVTPECIADCFCLRQLSHLHRTGSIPVHCAAQAKASSSTKLKTPPYASQVPVHVFSAAAAVCCSCATVDRRRLAG